MSETVFTKDKKLSTVTTVDNAFITGFLPAAPVLALKAYLYGLMLLERPAGDRGDIAAALGCTDTDIRAAFSYWEGLGLVTVIAEEPLQIRYNSIEGTRLGISPESGAKYGEFVRALQNVLGTRNFSGAELSKVYDWLDVFGFEPEAAVAIVARCLDKKGARTSVTYMDAVARGLSAKGALTLEAVKASFEEDDLMHTGVAKILKRWHQTRPPTEDELALYEKWTSGWGYDHDAVMLACSEMTAAEKPSFKYLDSIIEEWHKGGAVTSEQLKEKQRHDDSIREIAREAFSRAGIKSSPSFEHRQQIKEWTVDFCMSPELVYLAAELSKNDSRRFVRMRSLINDWHSMGISTVNAAQAYYDTYQSGGQAAAPAPRAKKNPALNYNQGGKYTRDELKKLGISFGEEFYNDGDDEQ